MSGWTHPICDDCWEHMHPDQIPVRLKIKELEKCCFCDEANLITIYIRHDPRELACGGEHGE